MSNMLHLQNFILCIFVGYAFSASIGNPCVIPNQKDKGQCVERGDCPKYLSLFQTSNLTMAKLSFIRRVHCEATTEDEETRVCCPTESSDYVNPTITINTTNLTVISAAPFLTDRLQTDDDTHLLPSHCGAAFGNRIFGGDVADLGEFPWMALLIYNSSRKLGCGGALISKRYVVTAAHCIAGKIYEEKGNLVSVRLGEYNTEVDTDCILNEKDNTLKCAEPSIEIPIDEIIMHQDYNPDSKSNRNDIALIRLAKDVKFTFFIKPICLPRNGLESGTNTGTRHTVAGWGQTDLYENCLDAPVSSRIQLKVKLPIVDINSCNDTYRPYSLNLAQSQICAGGDKGLDACLGDSGGPLMFLDKSRASWVLSGVVSLGLKKCGVAGVPGIYTKVENYVDWIEKKIR